MPRENFSSDVWVKRWQVEGTSGTYTVAKNRDGSFGCSCQGWITQKKEKWIINPDNGKLGRADCRHILQKKLELLQSGQLKQLNVVGANKNDHTEYEPDTGRDIEIEE